MKDYYQTLGVDRSASADEIKRAYRKLASKHHPDRGGDANTFKQVQEAYDILSDKRKRAEFDNPQGFFTQRNNFDDIVNQYFTQFDIRSQMRNSRMELWLSLEDVLKGGPKIISLPHASGSTAVEIQVPQGVVDGEAIRYAGLLPGGGDLVVAFRIQPHRTYRRDGMDLYTEVNANFWQLITGDKIQFTDLQGKTLALTIPPLTKPDSSLRMKNMGVQRKGHNNGDLFVKIKAVLPTSIPDEIVDILNREQNK